MTTENIQITVVGLLLFAGIVAFMIKAIFASKCDHFECCYGMLHIERNVELENRELQNSPNRATNIVGMLDSSIVSV